MNILAMSDLHGRIPKLPKSLLASRIDLLVLAGDIMPNDVANWDMSRWNDRRCDVAKEGAAQRLWWDTKFMPWVKNFKEVKKIVFVKGNHDFLDAEAIPDIIALNTGSKVIEIDDLKIGLLAGSMPLKGEWSDEVDEYEMTQRILNIDRDIDILISHVPPLGVMDRAYGGDLIGCKALREAIFGIGSAFEEQLIISPRFEKLRYAIYGHCHETRGNESQKIDGHDVTFLNVAETYCTIETSGNDLQHHSGRVSFHSK